jgi:hypothetical protein
VNHRARRAAAIGEGQKRPAALAEMPLWRSERGQPDKAHFQAQRFRAKRGPGGKVSDTSTAARALEQGETPKRVLRDRATSRAAPLLLRRPPSSQPPHSFSVTALVIHKKPSMDSVRKNQFPEPIINSADASDTR